MAGIRLEFAQRGHFDYFNIYRNSTSTEIVNLDQPLATCNTMYFEDLTIIQQQEYYYRVGAVRGDEEVFSDEIHISTATSDYLIEMKIEANAWVNKGAVPIVMNWTGTPTFETDAMVLNNTQWFDVPSNEVFNFGADNFEMSFEIYSTDISFYRILICGIYYDGRYSQLTFNETKPFMFETFGGFGENLEASTGITANKWHIVAMRRQSATLIEILIDDVVVASRAISPTVTINFNPNSGGTRFFNCTWSPDTTRFNGKVRRITLKR